MTQPPQRILVTGASGYVGSRLVALFADQGHQVHALMRKPEPSLRHPAVRTYHYDLSSAPNIDAFTDVDSVVHAAANMGSAQTLSEEAEVGAAQRLVEQAKSCGARKIVFISSQTAHPDAGNRYARTKWAIERIVLAEENGVVVRPGLVYGGCERGLFGVLSSLTKRVPCIPAFFPAPSIQPIHIDDLVSAILNILKETRMTLPVYNLAQSEPVPIGSFLRSVAWYRHRRYPPAVPVPLGLVTLLVQIGRAVPFLPEYHLERLRGFVVLQGQAMHGDIHCREAGVTPRSLADGLLDRPGGRRQLLEEGRSLFHYVSGSASHHSGLRHYTRAMENTRQGRSLRLPPFYLRFPWTLRLVDPKSPVHELTKDVRDELAWRLNFVVALAESTPLSASRFHSRRSRFILCTAACLAVQLVPELILAALAKVLNTLRCLPRIWGARDAR